MEELIPKLFLYNIPLAEYLVIDKKSEFEWRLIENYCRQLIYKQVEFNFSLTLVNEIRGPQAMQLVFKDMKQVHSLVQMAIKIRKDVVYTTYREQGQKNSVMYESINISNDQSNSMFNYYLQLQSALCGNNVYDVEIQPQYRQFNKTKFGIFDLLIFSHLNKNRSFHRIIQKLEHPEVFQSLMNWYNSFKVHFQVQYEFDPRYMPRKEQRSIKTEETNNKQNPSLFVAIETNNLVMFKNLIAGGASIYSITIKDRMSNEFIYQDVLVPHMVSLQGRLEFAQALTELGVDWECTDSDKMTPIFYAIKSQSAEMIQYLKDQSVNLEHPDIQDRTPFYYACSIGRLASIKQLYGYKVDINAKTKLGRTAFSKSSFLGLYEVIEFLLSCPEIDARFADNQGRDALHNAVFGPKGGRDAKKVGTWCRDSPEIAQLLLEWGMNVEVQDRDRNTPLHVAASSEALDSIAILVAFGGNIEAKNKWGETPLMIASKFGHMATVTLLVQQFNASLLAQNNDTLTAIEVAAKAGQFEIYEYLLARMTNYFRLSDDPFIYQHYLQKIMLQTKQFEDNKFIKVFVKQFDIKYSPDHLQLIFDIRNGQKELLQSYSKYVKITEKEIYHYLGVCLKSKNLALFIEIYNISVKPQLSLTSSRLELVLKFDDQDVIQLLFNYNFNWLSYRSKLGDTLLHKLVESRRTALIVKCLDYLKENKDYLLIQNDFGNTCIELCIIHQFMDIYEILQHFMEMNFGAKAGSKFHIIQYEVQFYDQAKLNYQFTKDLPQQQIHHLEDLFKLLNLNDLEMKYLLAYSIQEDNRQLIQVSTYEQLQQMMQDLDNYNIFGVDVEFHTEQKEVKFSFVSTLQISTVERDYIIDIMEVRSHKELLQQFFSSSKIKLFHGCESDLKVLYADLQICVNRLVDTGRLDMKLRNCTQVRSLKHLCSHYLNITIDKLHQKSDWRIRPLQQQMVKYACADASYLLLLFPHLMEKSLQSDQAIKLINSCHKLSQVILEKFQQPMVKITKL